MLTCISITLPFFRPLVVFGKVSEKHLAATLRHNNNNDNDNNNNNNNVQYLYRLT